MTQGLSLFNFNVIIPSILLENPGFVNVSKFFSKNVSAFLLNEVSLFSLCMDIHNWYQTFSEVSTTLQLKTLRGSTMSPFPTPSTPTRCRLCCISHSAQTSLNSLQIQLPQVLLVVNLASFWGYTPQYYALNALTERVPDICFISKILKLIWKFFFYQYADRPFKILGFPCNQFLRQVL